MKKSLSYISISIVSIAVFITLTGFFGDKTTPKLKPNELWMELAQSEAEQLKIALPSWAPLVRKVEGAVLVVRTESVIKGAASPFGDSQDPFEFFFGPRGRGQGQTQPERKARGQGSGFIIHPEGYALTNNHVIENATSIKVKVGSALKEYEAEVIGTDADTDVALLKIKSDRKDWPVIPLGSSTAVQVGDYAMAIGNPLGLELSVSSGIISARGRRDVHPSGKNGLFDFFQIDAPINPGNSGGPLLNLSGEVVGINTAMAQAQGIGFAIPIDQVKQILPQLKATGKASRSYLGVMIQPVTDELAQALKLSGRHGAVVREVRPNSPASKADIKPGDLITEFNGEIINDPSTLQLRAGLSGAGKKIPLKVLRNGQTIPLTITLEEMPKSDDDIAPSLPTSKDQTIQLFDGLSVVTLDDAARKSLKLDPQLYGARIAAIDPGAEGNLGLKQNDVIYKVNGSYVKTAKELGDIVKGTKTNGLLQFFVRRGSSDLYVYFAKP